MNDDSLGEFLRGAASDQEQQRVESLLADPETVVRVNADTAPEDSLIVALRVTTDQTVDPDSVRLLAERIEQLVPRQAISHDEIRQLLDEPADTGDLGRIAHYRIVEFVASGGSGLVFRAIDSHLNRTICIKLLKPASQFNDEAKARFQRESRDAAGLVHDRIVAVIDAGNQNGLPWFTMPLLDGVSLRKKIQQNGSIELQTALSYTRQIAEGLKYAHRHSVLHRDIKPDNIWVGPQDDIKILDFGLARIADGSTPITHSGTVVGTPSYMSPEQVTGKPCDERSDLFSLGVVLLEMLTGQSPFQRSNLFSTLMSVAGEQLDIDVIDPDSKIPAGVRSLISDLLQIDPNKRIPSANRLIERIDEVIVDPNRIRTNAGGKTSSTWWKLIAATLFGAAICLAGFAIAKLNDKGTLVIQAADPQVEIKIADEVVSVQDPVTGRNFEIKIGDTPLPSGVYQLETSDSSGDLVFSSDTITIRRGEKAIVTVSLIPTVENASNETSVVQSNDQLPEIAPENWADTSFDPVARDRFSGILPTLAAIPPLGDIDQPFTKTAIVQNPAKLEGIDSWTIEFDRTANLWGNVGEHFENCDGTLNARIGSSGVKIIENDRLKFILPVPATPAHVFFDDRFPNLLAVNNYVVDPDSSQPKLVDDFSDNWYEISIWRLNENDAELLYRIPASREYLVWDQGYRMVFLQNNKLAFFRLDTGRTNYIEGTQSDELVPSNLPLKDAFSPNRRFLALAVYGKDKEQQQLDVWDSETGRKSSSIPDTDASGVFGSYFQWKSDSSQIAARTRSAQYEYQIWESEFPRPVKTITVPGTSSEIKAFRLNDDFTRFAWLAADGTLTIRNRENDRLFFQKIPDELDLARLEWNRDGSLTVETKTSGYRWEKVGSSTYGGLVAIESRLAKKSPVDDTPPIKSRLVEIADFSDGAVTLVSKENQENNTNRTLDLIEYSIARISLADLPSGDIGMTPVRREIRPETQRDFRSDVRRSPLSGSISSPNGQFMLSAKTFGPGARERNDLYLVDLNDVDRSIDFENRLWVDRRDPYLAQFLKTAAWSPDSRFVVFAAKVDDDHPRTPPKMFCFDTLTEKLFDFQNLELPKQLEVLGIWTWHKQFLIRGSDNRSWLFDPVSLTASETQLFEEFESYEIISIHDDSVFFEGRKLDEPAEKFASSIQYFRGKFSADKFTELYSVEGKRYLEREKGNDDSRTSFVRLFSNDGDYFFDKPISKVTPQSSRIHLPLGVYSWTLSKPNQPSFVIDLENFEYDSSPPTWHSSKNVVAWSYHTTRHATDNFFTFNAESVKSRRSLVGLPGVSMQFIPADFGWLLTSGFNLIAVDFEGHPLGNLFFDLTSAIPANPRWILADGAMDAKASKEGLFIAYIRNNRVHGELLTEFISNADNPKLPEFDTVPFLEIDQQP